jgi:type I restriction enzyme, S subunit
MEMLPEGWTHRRLGEIASFKNGLNFTRSDHGESIKIVGVSDFKDRSQLDGIEELATIQVGDVVRDAELLASGDLLFVRSNGNRALIGRCLYFPKVEGRLAYSGFTIRGRVKKSVLDPAYASYLMRSAGVTGQMFLGGSGTNISNLSQEMLASIELLVPSLVEQQRIAQVLTLWDEAILIAQRASASLEVQHSIVVGTLTSGRQRFDAKAAWKTRSISELIRESRIAGSGGHEARKLTVKLYGKGVIYKADRRPGSEATRYYCRSAGQFIYSKLDFLNGAFGIVPEALDGYESTLDLPAFDFLPDVDPQWFLHFVSREEFYQGQLGLANGGRKARRVNPDDLLRVRIDVPPYQEQRAIANAIGVAGAQVDAARQRVELLKQEKVALMSDLLTGKRRVRAHRQGSLLP